MSLSEGTAKICEQTYVQSRYYEIDVADTNKAHVSPLGRQVLVHLIKLPISLYHLSSKSALPSVSRLTQTSPRYDARVCRVEAWGQYT